MRMHRLTVLAFAATLAASVATPGLAEKNTGAFPKSSEAFKLGLSQVCADFAERANALDKEARNSALPDSPKHDAANFVREVGHALGCKI